ncbi:hypothetical protein AAHC03_017147 [Spirometra sp. Aus1]
MSPAFDKRLLWEPAPVNPAKQDLFLPNPRTGPCSPTVRPNVGRALGAIIPEGRNTWSDGSETRLEEFVNCISAYFPNSPITSAMSIVSNTDRAPIALSLGCLSHTPHPTGNEIVETAIHPNRTASIRRVPAELDISGSPHHMPPSNPEVGCRPSSAKRSFVRRKAS